MVTGLPTLDQIRQPASCFADPWPARQGRKRIIWAPHYSVGSEHYEGLAYSNFLEMADAMQLEGVARARKQEVIFAILKAHAKSGESISGEGVLEILHRSPLEPNEEESICRTSSIASTGS